MTIPEKDVQSLPLSPLGLNRATAGALLTSMVTTAIADAVLDGYPEYATGVNQLDVEQRRVLAGVAEAIVRSHSTRNPVDAVAVIGHADKALRKPVAERAAFEMDVSQQRATSARQMLLAQVQSLASGAHFSKVLLIVDIGLGNARPVFASAGTEAQMKKNRRVEIFLFQSHHSGSHCAVR
jgi:flagellar motor protein MotB